MREKRRANLKGNGAMAIIIQLDAPIGERVELAVREQARMRR